MGTPFSEIYNMFLADITDDTFLLHDPEDAEKILDGLRRKAITRFNVCNKDLYDIDLQEQQFNEVLNDREKIIIATIMRKYWLNDKMYNLGLIKQRMSTKDFKLTSQAEHLLRLTVLNKELEAEISHMIVQYTLYNNKNKGG